MEIMELRANTILKLKMKKIPEEKMEKLSEKIMAGNKATIKKIINEWLRDGSKISCDFFFDTFTKRSSKKILGVLSIDNIKNLIKYELERQLRYNFKNNKKIASFQKIVEHAINCVERSIDERVRTSIPMWLIENFKYVDKKVLSSEEIWFDKIKKKNRDYEEINQDAYELVDLLEYHKYLRDEAVRLSNPIFNRATRLKKKDVELDLEKLERNITSHLNSMKIPKHVKNHIIENKFVVKDDVKLFLKQLRKDFEAFVLFEKYGHIPDEFFGKREGITKLIRSPAICLDYMEELDSLDVREFNLNTITVNLSYKKGKKKAMKLWKRMAEDPNIKVYKTGSTGNNFYIIYDYCAPKSWFDEKVLKSLEKKVDCWLSKKPLFIKKEVEIDFDFPYYSNRGIQFRMAQNYAIFCSKLKLTGLSSKKDYNPFSVDGFTYRTINPYQIYLPFRRKLSKTPYLQKEYRKKEYLNLWGSFHHKVSYNKQGELSKGGNHMKIFGGCNDPDLEMFFNETKCKIPAVYKDLEIAFSDVKDLEHVNDSIKDTIWEIVCNGLYCDGIHYLLNFVKRYKKEKMREISHNIQVGLKKILRVERSLDRGDVIDKKALALEYRTLLRDFKSNNDDLKEYGIVKKTISCLKRGHLYDSNEMVKLLIKPISEYCKSVYGRRILIHRPIVSVAKLMANNLNIVPITKTTRFGTRTFHEYRDIYMMLDAKKEAVRMSSLIKLLIDVAIACDFKDLFFRIFHMLYNKDFDVREKLLLI